MSLTTEPSSAVAIPVLPIQPVGDEVVVWSKPSCVQCVATERALGEKGIPHRMLDLTEHPDALTILKNANYLQAPFVQHGDDVWTGFRPDKIDEIARAIA